MTATTEIKLIMWTSIVDEQIKSRTQTRNMNSTTISNRKDRNTYDATGAAPLALRLSPMSLRKRLPRSGKKSSWVMMVSLLVLPSLYLSISIYIQQLRECAPQISTAPAEWSAGGSGCRGRCGRRMERRSSTWSSRWCSSLVSISTLISISTTLLSFL